MSYGGGYSPGGYSPGGYSPGGYSPGGYSPGGYSPGGNYTPGVSTTDLQQAGFVVAADDQSATDGGLTLYNDNTGTSSLANVPGISTDVDENAGYNNISHPSSAMGTLSTQTQVPDDMGGGTETTTVGASQDANIANQGNGNYQVTSGAVTVQTVSTDAAGNVTGTSYVNVKADGTGGYVTVSQPMSGGAIGVHVGSLAH